MSRIVITGGAGFIGAFVGQALVQRGNEVVLFDDFNDRLYPASLKRARLENFFGRTPLELFEGTILNAAALDRALSPKPVDVVVHLAAHANPGASVREAQAYTENNVIGTLRVLEAVSRHAVPRLIFAGSSSVYDDAALPFREDAYPLHPHSPYSASKAAAELYCSLWHELHGLSVTILRFFSVYGPWGRPDMAAMIFAQALLTGKPIELTRDERQRDFTHVDDIVAGVLAAAATPFDFEIINLGRGEPTSLRDLIAALEAAAGVRAEIVERPTPPGEMAVTCADISKARQLLGYQPKISVPEGVRGLVTWMRDWYLPQFKG